ncbi:adenine nucleotide alpha hydrolases-like protein, partial [Aureobasidium melanogenum]
MNPSPIQSPKATPTQDNPEGETSDIPSQSLAFGGSSYNPADKPRPLPIRFHSSDDSNPARRTSVQFMPNVRVAGGATEASRSRSRRPIPIKETSATRRLSSPPPPTQFKPRVSFDTFDNRDASDFSLTLSRKHREYEYTKRSRTFLCGTDTNDYSDTALEWLIDELVDDGDEVVCLRVVEKDSKEAAKWAGGGSDRGGRERSYRKEANRMLERIEEKNTEDKAINIILEFSIGKVQDTIQRMIRIYEPAILVVGTRGRSLGGFQGLLPGSVSKYCLQHSPVPVIVVRPSSKRDKKKRQRLEDPTRRGYRDILDKSDNTAANGAGYTLDPLHRLSIMPGDGLGALPELETRDAEEEARMVAEAIGYRPDQIAADGEPLSRVTSARSDVSRRSGRSARSGSFGSNRSESPETLRSPSRGLIQSPQLRAVPDSGAETSEFDDSDDERDNSAAQPHSAYYEAQERALMEARERALKAEEEEKERERQTKEKKENARSGGGGGVLDLLDQLGGGSDEPKGSTRGKKSRYPIP